MTDRLIRVACSCLLAAVAACDLIDPPHPGDYHRCQIVETGGNWAYAHLTLFHNDARQCPLAPLIGEIVSTGATIEDMDAASAGEDATSVEITMRNVSGGLSCGSQVGYSTADFSWMDWDYDDVDDWAAQPSVAYPARTGETNETDCAYFQVHFPTSSPAYALVSMHYFGEQW